MPHLTVEYSCNLERVLDIERLVKAVHQAAISTGVFELAAVRTRAERRDVYQIADGGTENMFINVGGRIAPRPQEVRHAVGKAIFDAVCQLTKDIFEKEPLAISVEILEVDNAAAFRRNNLHDRLRKATG